VGAVLRCRSLEGNDHAARPAPCAASHPHTHHCPGYSWTVAKCRFRLRSLSAQIHRPTPQRLTFRRAWRFIDGVTEMPCTTMLTMPTVKASATLSFARLHRKPRVHMAQHLPIQASLYVSARTAAGLAINLHPASGIPESVRPAAAQYAVACGDEGCSMGDFAGRMQSKGDFHELGYR